MIDYASRFKTVTSSAIADDSITNIDINSAAAIAGTKIAPAFGAQTITTSGDINLDTDKVVFDSNGNCWINTGGNVGIGNTDPQTPLAGSQHP